MTSPRRIGDKLLESIDQVLPFLNLYLVPEFKLLRRKLAGMLQTPREFAVPLWDNETWHSVQLGTVAPDAPNVDGYLTVSNGTHIVMRESVITGDRIYALNAASIYDQAFIWNMTTSYTALVMIGITMSIPPMHVGAFLYDPATVAWVGTGRLPIYINP